jgi:hypothetical protein
MSELSPRLDRVLRKVFVEPVRGSTRRLRDGVPPQTAIRRMEASVHRACDRLSQNDLDGFVNDLIEMIRNAPEQQFHIDVPVANGDAEAAVYTVFDKLDAALPLGTIALLTMMVGVARPQHSMTHYESERLGQRVEDACGEERALQLKEFAWHVIENEQVPFLHVLLQAMWIAEGLRFRAGNSIGDWTNEVKQRGLLGSLLWSDAPRVRNAASHRLGWIPNIDRGTILLHDARKPPAAPWTQEVDVDDLFRQLRDVVDMTCTLSAVLHRAFMRDLVAPIQEPFIRAIRTGVEDPALIAFGKAFVQRLLSARDRMFALGWTLAV